MLYDRLIEPSRYGTYKILIGWLVTINRAISPTNRGFT